MTKGRTEQKAYFKDIYNIQPFHYDCTLGKLKLPWNDQEIDIFVNNDVENRYRPVVDGVYASEESYIDLRGEYFTKADLTEYVHRVQDYEKCQQEIRQERTRVLVETAEIIKQQMLPALRPCIKGPDNWLLVYCGSYALHYDPETTKYSILKYNTQESIERRYWWWNVDKTFEKIESDSRNEIVKQFLLLTDKEIRKSLSGLLLYQDKRCKCYLDFYPERELHFELNVEDITLSYILTPHPQQPACHAECEDNRFSFLWENKLPPLRIDSRNEWETFCHELADILLVHRMLVLYPNTMLPYRQMFWIEYNDDSVSYMNSKLGGSFFWPDNDPPDQNLNFLAQFNLSELPENSILPKCGILQFFIGDDEDFGLFDGKNGYRVIYHKNLSSGHEMKSLKNDNDVRTPIIRPCSIKFTLGKESMSTSDFCFTEHIKDLDDVTYEALSRGFSGEGSKVLGYPFFTQDDPRTVSEENKKYNTLLLQLDSDNKYIEWGDNGVCNFFINDKALEKADFSDVLYNWDCF